LTEGTKPGEPLGRVALVMAGSRGIGRGCAEALAASGHAVVVAARGARDLDETVAALRASGAPAAGISADLNTSAGIAAMVNGAMERFGRVDVLVANSGGPAPGRFADLDDAAWLSGWESTFMSVVRALRACLPGMQASGFGRVVVIGSSSARRSIPGLDISNALRPALYGLVKTLAAQSAPHGVTVNMIAPGRVDTDRIAEVNKITAEREGISEDEARRRSESAVPAGRFGTTAELGAVAAFLASEAAGYLTGQCLLVDGGLVDSL
jgi:3-oxoacyl-[acyl-carrier protein] reductase